MDFLKHRKDCNWIHSRNKTAEDEAVQNADGPPKPAKQWNTIQGSSNETCTDAGVYEGQQQNGSQVIKKGTHRHKVTSIEDDGWKKIDEEDICIQDVFICVCDFGEVKKGAHNEAHHNEETTLRYHSWQLGIQMECCCKKNCKNLFPDMSYIKVTIKKLIWIKNRKSVSYNMKIGGMFQDTSAPISFMGQTSDTFDQIHTQNMMDLSRFCVPQYLNIYHQYKT